MLTHNTQHKQLLVPPHLYFPGHIEVIFDQVSGNGGYGQTRTQKYTSTFAHFSYLMVFLQQYSLLNHGVLLSIYKRRGEG